MIKKKNNNPVILYLTDSSLSLQTEKKVLSTISFPKELVDGKKIIDTQALQSFLAEKIKKIPEIQSVKALIIGKGLLFQTAVPREDSASKEEEFYSSIPFEKSDISERRIQTSSKEYILVTSKKFYQTILNILIDQSVQVSFIVPLSLFIDEVDEDVLKNEEVKTILSKEQLYSQANFLESTESVPEETPVEKKTEEQPSAPASLPYTLAKKWNITALLIILGFLVVSTIIFGVFLVVEQRRFLGNPTPTPTPSSTISPEPTKAPAQVDKGSLTVSVLNGTGTAGQAGKVKAIFEDIGYNSVETGNADAADNEKTTVSFSKKVSSVQGDEIVKELEKIFTKVTRATDDTLSNDIVVVTGEEK